jgi:hypothetical protein
MTVQIAVKLDDGLAEQVKAAAEDAGTNLCGYQVCHTSKL